MGRFTGTERAVLVIAMIFFAVGMMKIIYPTEDGVVHQVYHSTGFYVEHVSKNGSRFYGALAIFIAAGLISMVLYGRRK